MQAIYVNGEYVTAKYTHNAALVPGDIIVVNGRVLITHNAVAADVQGEYAIGGGVYDFLATSGDVIAWGDAVEWNDTTDVAEEETSGNSPIGIAIKAKADGELVVRAYHALP